MRLITNPMSKTDELISKLDELIEQYKAYYDSQQSPAVKIMPSWMEYNNQLESEISELKEQIKEEQCHNIYDKVKEANKPENRSFEEMEQIKKEEKTPMGLVREAFGPIQNVRCSECNELIGTNAAHICQNKFEPIQRQNKVFDFVVRHKIDCYNAFKLSIAHEGYTRPEGKKLIALARQEIGYSDKTWSGDIYSSLYNTYKSIVVDGVNEPEQTPALDCGIYEEKHNPDFIGFDEIKASLPYPEPVSKHQTDINIGWVRAMKYMDKSSSGMREFVISEIQKGIVHPNPLTPSEMRVLNLCCKYMESHE